MTPPPPPPPMQFRIIDFNPVIQLCILIQIIPHKNCNTLFGITPSPYAIAYRPIYIVQVIVLSASILILHNHIMFSPIHANQLNKVRANTCPYVVNYNYFLIRSLQLYHKHGYILIIAVIPQTWIY